MTQHTPHDEGQDDVATTPTTTDRWKALDFARPSPTPPSRTRPS